MSFARTQAKCPDEQNQMRNNSPYLMHSFVFFLVIAGCSREKKPTAEYPLHFNWETPAHFQVVETIFKKGSELKILHDCELTRTNGEYLLEWPDAKIIEFDGQKVDGSKDLMQAVKPLQVSFRYPSFRIAQNGDFIEAIDLEQAVQRADQMMDQVVTNRTEDNRRFFSQYGKSEDGRQMLNQVFGSIWQTWVGAWAGVTVADGDSASVTNFPSILGTEVPAYATLSNLGQVAAHPDYIGLKYKQDVTITNFAPVFNNLIEKMAKETDIPSAGPITNECSMRRLTILSVQTQRETLKPHWARESIKSIVAIPGEETSTNLELHDFEFLWNGETATKFSRWQ